eukprot:6473566-Amphidinium_carterae.1
MDDSKRFSTVHGLTKSRQRQPHVLVCISKVSHSTPPVLGVVTVSSRSTSPDGYDACPVHQDRLMREHWRNSGRCAGSGRGCGLNPPVLLYI